MGRTRIVLEKWNYEEGVPKTFLPGETKMPHKMDIAGHSRKRRFHKFA